MHDRGGSAGSPHAGHGGAATVRGLAAAEGGLQLVVETPELHRDAVERLQLQHQGRVHTAAFTQDVG